jgi:hypothetical protein
MTVIKVGDIIKSRNFPKVEDDYFIGVVTHVDDKVVQFRSTRRVRGSREWQENREYITAAPNRFLSDCANPGRIEIIS